MASRACIGPDERGRRLDDALELLVPGLGLRGRRRLIDDGRVTVDGALRPAGYRLRLGEVLALEVADHVPQAMPELRLLAESLDYAAVHKPAGLHSAALAGRDAPSAEALLPALFSGRRVLLVNRLDRETSGILLAALSEPAAGRYRRRERQGLVEKTYALRVAGRLDAEVVVKNRLETAGGAKVRVLAEDDPDPARWTRFSPAAARGEFADVTAVIHRGARHQIRAHAASLGVPIVGDDLYGGPPAARLFLHCAAVRFPDFAVQDPPDWESD